MARNKKNPLQGMIDFYEKSVKKSDKKGFAEMYKGATECVLEEAKNCVECLTGTGSGISLTVEDLEYSDGYYIFGMGTNKVVSFHVKENPGWLYGIWWDDPEANKNEDGEVTGFTVHGQLFAQYEENIDKFKPSYSEIKETVVALYESKGDGACKFTGIAGGFAKIVKYIHDEPELAFCRDYCGWNYNEEYHTRAEAKKEFTKYKKYLETEKAVRTQCNQIMLDALKRVAEDMIKDSVAFIHDQGECVSPRYELIINKDKAGGDWKDVKPGWYWLGDQEEGKVLEREEKRCEKIAKKNKVWWFSDISMHYCVADGKTYKKFRKEEE